MSRPRAGDVALVALVAGALGLGTYEIRRALAEARQDPTRYAAR